MALQSGGAWPRARVRQEEEESGGARDLERGLARGRARVRGSVVGWLPKRWARVLHVQWVRVGLVGAAASLLLLWLLLPAGPLGHSSSGPVPGPPPAEETPLEPLDRGDGIIRLHNLDYWKTKTKAVLVFGIESSGSKLVARALARRIVYPGLSAPPGSDRDWDGHGGIGNATLGTFVLHRSIPHNDHFPHVETILNQFHFLQFQVFVVVATRDREISFRSRLATHQPDAVVAHKEHNAGIRALHKLLAQRAFPTTVFSYESLMLLGDPYYNLLFDFIQEPLHEHPRSTDTPAIPRMFVPPVVVDGNAKYVKFESLSEALWRYFLYFWAPRRPTVGHPTPPPTHTQDASLDAKPAAEERRAAMEQLEQQDAEVHQTHSRKKAEEGVEGATRRE